MTERAAAPSILIRLKSITLLLLGGFCLIILGWVGWQAWLMYHTPFEIPRPDARTDFDKLLPKQFDYANLTIPRDELQLGAQVDGIPSLSEPKLVKADNANYLKDADRVIGVSIEGESKAYPLMVLERHEAVNDSVGNTSVLVTYCPLCDSSAVFDRQIKGKEFAFGISGLLYNSNVLLYDRDNPQSPSLWSQMRADAVSGPMRGASLKALPMEVTTWGDWRKRYPETRVLSNETGHDIDYTLNPYLQYFSIPQLMFPVKPLDKRLNAKARVLIVWSPTKSRVYPLDRFSELTEPAEFAETLDGRAFKLRYSPEGKTLSLVDADGDLKGMYSFWFAWAAFHPEAEISSLPADL